METTPGTVYLHIGPMKTGTSYLQQLMADNQQQLASAGLLFPGDNPRTFQNRAVRRMLRTSGANPARRPPRSWRRLQGAILAAGSRSSVVSMEFMSFAGPGPARAIVTSLEPAEVHVILTLRDASRVLPSAWATTTRNRHTATWAEHAEAVLRGPKGAQALWRRSMRALDVPRMLEVWGAHVPPERLHVVPVPPSGAPPGLLWQRFASVLRVDPEVATTPVARRNESFGYASAELMRRLNQRVSHLSNAEYSVAARYLCKEILDHREGEPKVPMTPRLNEFARKWNDLVASKVLASRVCVHGDLDDLAVAPGLTQEQIEPVPPEALLSAARDAATALASLTGRGRRAVGTRTGIDSQPDATAGDPGVDTTIDTTIDTVTELFEAVARAHSDRPS